MAFPDRRTADVLLTILFFAVVCIAVYCSRRVILVVVFAVFFSYLIDPVVKFLQLHFFITRKLRGPAVVQVYLALLILLTLLGYTFAPGVARSTVKLVDEVPVFLDGLSTGDIVTQLGGKYGWSEEQQFRVRTFLARHKEKVQGLGQDVDYFLSDAAQVLCWLPLIPILAIFFLRDGAHITDVFIRVFFPTEQRPTIRGVANDLHIMLSGYMSAQVLLCGIAFLFYSSALLLLRFPHAIALAVLGGLLEFIPVVGWLSTLAAITSVGVVSHSHWTWMVVLLGTWRLAQDYYISPRIMGRHLEIQPLAAILAVLAGAEIGGIVGIYLAIPITASIGVIWPKMGRVRGQVRKHGPTYEELQSGFRNDEKCTSL